MHSFVMGLVATCEGGGVPNLPQGDPAQNVMRVRGRLMLDVSYVGSVLVGQAGTVVEGPSPGERFPACHRLSGTGHHLVVFGEAPRLDQLSARWGTLVSIVDAAGAHFDAAEAGVPSGGVILVRPDGFIGFRATPADETTMDAIDAHLASYLVPVSGASCDVWPPRAKRGPTTATGLIDANPCTLRRVGETPGEVDPASLVTGFHQAV